MLKEAELFKLSFYLSDNLLTYLTSEDYQDDPVFSITTLEIRGGDRMPDDNIFRNFKHLEILLLENFDFVLSWANFFQFLPSGLKDVTFRRCKISWNCFYELENLQNLKTIRIFGLRSEVVNFAKLIMKFPDIVKKISVFEDYGFVDKVMIDYLGALKSDIYSEYKLSEIYMKSHLGDPTLLSLLDSNYTKSNIRSIHLDNFTICTRLIDILSNNPNLKNLEMSCLRSPKNVNYSNFPCIFCKLKNVEKR